MSSARSRNYRRRRGEDDDAGGNDFVSPTITKINGAASESSATNKPPKSTPLNPRNRVLSFADDDEESPASRLPSNPLSSNSPYLRFTKSKDRSSSHHLRTHVRSSIHIKEYLLELQKNTVKYFTPNKPDPEPDVIELDYGEEDEWLSDEEPKVLDNFASYL